MKRLNVLVADDEEDLREILCEVLGGEAMRTFAARDGVEALARLRDPTAPPIDVLLLDMMMPRKTGWDVRREQLADPSIASIPTIVMTAAANLGARPVEAAAVLRKPVDLETVVSTIRAVMAAKT